MRFRTTGRSKPCAPRWTARKISAVPPSAIFRSDGVAGLHVWGQRPSEHFLYTMAPGDTKRESRAAGSTRKSIARGVAARPALDHGLVLPSSRMVGAACQGSFQARWRAAGAAALLLLLAPAGLGCAPSLATMQPAHVAPRGHVQATAAMEVGIPDGGIDTVVDSGRQLATAAQSGTLTDEQKWQALRRRGHSGRQPALRRATPRHRVHGGRSDRGLAFATWVEPGVWAGVTRSCDTTRPAGRGGRAGRIALDDVHPPGGRPARGADRRLHALDVRSAHLVGSAGSGFGFGSDLVPLHAL